jgi:hypothetical protein
MFLEPEPPAFSVQPHVIVVRDHRAAGITRGVALGTAAQHNREVVGPALVRRHRRNKRNIHNTVDFIAVFLARCRNSIRNIRPPIRNTRCP